MLCSVFILAHTKAKKLHSQFSLISSVKKKVPFFFLYEYPFDIKACYKFKQRYIFLFFIFSRLWNKQLSEFCLAYKITVEKKKYVQVKEDCSTDLNGRKIK